MVDEHKRLEMCRHDVAARSQPVAVSPEAWETYRSAYRALGIRHRLVDRWRWTLGWRVPDHVVSDWLAEERAKLVVDGKGPH